MQFTESICCIRTRSIRRFNRSPVFSHRAEHTKRTEHDKTFGNHAQALQCLYQITGSPEVSNLKISFVQTFGYARTMDNIIPSSGAYAYEEPAELPENQSQSNPVPQNSADCLTECWRLLHTRTPAHTCIPRSKASSTRWLPMGTAGAVTNVLSFIGFLFWWIRMIRKRVFPQASTPVQTLPDDAMTFQQAHQYWFLIKFVAKIIVFSSFT